MIYDHERLLGWQAKKIRGENFSIEQSAHWMKDELDEIPIREFDPWELTEEEKEELRTEHLPFWANRTLVAKWIKRVPEPERQIEFNGIYDCFNFLSNVGSHFLPDFDQLMAIGFKGYHEMAQKGLENLDPDDPRSLVDKTDSLRRHYGRA